MIGPEKAVAGTTKYLTLDAGLNVTDLQDDKPDPTSFTGLAPKIKFSSVLGNGQAPDDALPTGTCIQTEVTASNASGSDTKSSLCFTPIESIGPNATMHGLRFENTRSLDPVKNRFSR